MPRPFIGVSSCLANPPSRGPTISLKPPPAAPPREGALAPSAEPLTPREREVALLLARGLTNREIAAKLVIAEGRAGIHVDHILAKLGFHSRAQVAAWVVERGLSTGP